MSVGSRPVITVCRMGIGKMAKLKPGAARAADVLVALPAGSLDALGDDPARGGGDCAHNPDLPGGRGLEGGTTTVLRIPAAVS